MTPRMIRGCTLPDPVVARLRALLPDPQTYRPEGCRWRVMVDDETFVVFELVRSREPVMPPVPLEEVRAAPASILRTFVDRYTWCAL